MTNYNLLKHGSNNEVNKFINVMTSNLLLPQIIGPTRFALNQKPSLLVNIFMNIMDRPCTSGNLYSKISDHLPNFIIIEDTLTNTMENKKIFKRDTSRFNEINFINDINTENVV